MRVCRREVGLRVGSVVGWYTRGNRALGGSVVQFSASSSMEHVRSEFQHKEQLETRHGIECQT